MIRTIALLIDRQRPPIEWLGLGQPVRSSQQAGQIVAKDLNNLAGLLRATNRLTEAEPLYRRALAIDEKSYGPNHPEVATDLNNLALLLMDAKRLGEAEPLHRRALAIDEKSFDPEHPTVAIRSTIWPGCCALQTG